MKPEHKEKLLSHLEGIESSSNMIKMMLDGSKPANQQTALELTRKIERLLEMSRTIVDIS
jgi:hypothetical protein